MKWTIINLSLSLLILLLSSCTDEVKQYQSDLAEQQEQFVKTVETSKLRYQIQYQPLGMQVMRASKDSEGATVDINQFAGHRYFKLSIQAKNGKSLEKSIDAETLNQLQFHSQKRFYLKSSTETLPCMLYHAMPTGFQSKGLELILVFQDPEVKLDDSSSRDLTFVFEDDLLSQQTITATFLAVDFNELPKLKI